MTMATLPSRRFGIASWAGELLLARLKRLERSMDGTPGGWRGPSLCLECKKKHLSVCVTKQKKTPKHRQSIRDSQCAVKAKLSRALQVLAGSNDLKLCLFTGNDPIYVSNFVGR